MTLFKYIFNEIWPTFLASLFVFVFIMMAAQMLSIAELIVNRGVGIAYVAKMILFILPDIIAFAMPAVALMSVVVAFLRLSADSEIIALKASGISLYQMLPPVAAVSVLAFFISLAIAVFAAPWGTRSFKDLVFQIAQSKADLGIKERVFSEPFHNVTVFVSSFSSRERIMRDVFLVDRRDPEATNTIIAERAHIILHPEEKMITIHFVDGSIFSVTKDLDSARTIEFKTYDLNIGLKDIMASVAARRKKPYELSLGELLKQLKTLPKDHRDYYQIRKELFEKASLPLAVLFMGFIGAPLGAQIRSRGRTTGIGVSLTVFAVYYMFLAGTRSIVGNGALHPAIGVWIPDVFLAIACIYIFRRAVNERPLNLLQGFSLKQRRIT